MAEVILRTGVTSINAACHVDTTGFVGTVECSITDAVVYALGGCTLCTASVCGSGPGDPMRVIYAARSSESGNLFLFCEAWSAGKYSQHTINAAEVDVSAAMDTAAPVLDELRRQSDKREQAKQEELAQSAGRATLAGQAKGAQTTPALQRHAVTNTRQNWNGNGAGGSNACRYEVAAVASDYLGRLRGILSRHFSAEDDGEAPATSPSMLPVEVVARILGSSTGPAPEPTPAELTKSFGKLRPLSRICNMRVKGEALIEESGVLLHRASVYRANYRMLADLAYVHEHSNEAGEYVPAAGSSSAAVSTAVFEESELAGMLAMSDEYAELVGQMGLGGQAGWGGIGEGARLALEERLNSLSQRMEDALLGSKEAIAEMEMLEAAAADIDAN